MSGSTICGSSLEASGFEADAAAVVVVFDVDDDDVTGVFEGRTLTGLSLLLLLLAGVGFVFGTPLTGLLPFFPLTGAAAATATFLSAAF